MTGGLLINFQPLMGNGNPGISVPTKKLVALFQPLMGNGNGLGGDPGLGLQCLPTPHGERERGRPPGLRCRSDAFQPLMGNGNPPGSGRRCAGSMTSNPSWGTGTLAALRMLDKRHGLPTPHGEREPSRSFRPKTHRFPSNPSWGTGTTFAERPQVIIIIFQPLMGNGNPVDGLSLDGDLKLPTPHGEREPDRGGVEGQGRQPSNPSWGTGTPAVARLTCFTAQLPTPYGERERVSAVVPRGDGRLPTPHGEREPPLYR